MASMPDQKTDPMSLRLSPELAKRLEECAKRLRLKRHTLARDAIEAAIEAIEKNGYRLVIPIEFEVKHVPTVQDPGMEDRPPGKSSKGITNQPQPKTKIA